MEDFNDSSIDYDLFIAAQTQKALENRHVNEGYLLGIQQGQESKMQVNFDRGFVVMSSIARNVGKAKGILDAYHHCNSKKDQEKEFEAWLVKVRGDVIQRVLQDESVYTVELETVIEMHQKIESLKDDRLRKLLQDHINQPPPLLFSPLMSTTYTK